jgi:transcriptional regulator with XRE-family HTH domain
MLGDLVRAHRRRLGLSQEDLANRAGLSVRSIRKIETHHTGTPRPATVRLLADAFGLRDAERDSFCAAALGDGDGQWVPDQPQSEQLPAGRRPGPLPAQPTLIGRRDELAALDPYTVEAAGGILQVAWIGGEAGTGKSTLAAALTAALARRGWRTAWGRSPEIEGTPSAWAWADVGHGLTGTTVDSGQTGDDEQTGLRVLLGGGTPTPGRPAFAPFWLARAVVELLRRSTGPRPLLVVLDDVHRAGDETLQILQYVATELVDSPVMVLATYRPTEVGTALRATWAALAGPRVHHLDLGGLAEADVGLLLREHTGAPLAPEVVRLITARTGGNPLFVAETARLIAAEGVAAATETVPTGVGDVLRRRLAGLPDRAQVALRTAAVLGIEFDTEVLLSLDPTGSDTVLDGLEAAVQAGLLTEPAPGVLRFSHALVRDTIYQDLPLLRRADLHARVLAALEPIRPGDVVALAHHALSAATPTTAVPAAVRAADAARAASAVCAHQDATALLERALAILETVDRPVAGQPGSPPDPSTDIDDLRLDLLCALVSAQGHAGNVRGGRASRDRAIGLARQLGGRHRLTRAYTAYDAPTLWTLREYQQFDLALVVGLESTLVETAEEDAAARCRLLATLANETEASDPEGTGDASAEAVAIAERLGDPELICRALNARYRYVATLGPDGWGELTTIGRRQLAVATAAGLNSYQTQGHHILGMAELAGNNLDRARWYLDRAVEHATCGQLGLAQSILAMYNGLCVLIAGRFDEAERTYAPIIAQLGHLGYPNAHEMDLLVRFCIEHARGGPDSRQRMAALAEQSHPVYERFRDAVAEPYTRTLIAAGRIDQARAVWRPEIPLPRDHYWFRWTVLRAENAVHLDNRAVAATCYGQLLPWTGHLPGLLHAHVTLGPVDHTLGDLAVALGRPDAAAHHYADAIAVADRIGAAHWATRSRDAITRLSVDTKVSG